MADSPEDLLLRLGYRPAACFSPKGGLTVREKPCVAKFLPKPRPSTSIVVIGQRLSPQV